MNIIASVNNHQTPWLLPTSVALTLLIALYVFFIFPKDNWSIIIPYISAFAVTLVAIFLGIVIFKYYKKVKTAEYSKQRNDHNKKIKSIEQLIWRNRFVLQSAKDEIMEKDTINKDQQWNDIKVAFIRSKVFPVIPETEVPLETVSNIVKKALGASSLNSSKPPVYKVKSIKEA